MTRRGVTLLTTVLAGLLGVTIWRLQGPVPRPASAPSDQFSAARAIAELRGVLAEEVPHPVGTAANRRVRDRIVTRLKNLGHSPVIQRAFVCNSDPSCATVENIVALPPGQGRVVLLTAHYDSVAAGPGASDDGSGVAAILETARALGPQPRIGILFTDGEEAGLLGAEAFAASPFAHRVDIIVNVEARGTSGPSFLFETSRGNSGLVNHMRAMKMAFASSLFYTVYDTLPNDTDLSVFKRAGFDGLNFAAIGDVWNYHTPFDDLAHIDARTMQHHGDNVLAVARSLSGGVERTGRNAVFFDILGFTIVSWPEGVTPIVALLSLAALLIGSRSASRATPVRGMLTGIAFVLLTIVLAVLASMALTWIAHLRAGGAFRLAYPQALITAMWLAGAWSALVVASVLR
ncbi:MAG: M28 family peptidase, partial [Thermoanaerobaculia bacterium]